MKTRLMDVYNKDAYVPFSIDGLQGAILLDELVNDPQLKGWYDAILANGGMIQNVGGEQLVDGSYKLVVTTLNTTGTTSKKEFIIGKATADALLLETETREQADTALEAKITEEKNARTEADTAINAEIATVRDSVVGKKSKTWNGFAEVFNNINENKATADCAHAEGTQTTASEQAAHAEGKKTVASKPYAHAEGDQTQATASSSHSEGFGTRASGYASHAEGGSTVASGNFTHAGGEHTKAANYAEQAIGYYNKSTYVNNNGQWKGDSESTLFSVGNGTSESDRKNALEIKQDGTVLVQKPGTKEMAKVYDGLMTAEEKASLEQLPTQLTAEQTARTNADKVLTANLAKEVTDRTNAVNAEATAREQADTAINGEIQGIKDKGTLHDLFLASGATYNQDTKMYQLNGLDLTFDEMLKSFIYTYPLLFSKNWIHSAEISDIRTNIKPFGLMAWGSVGITINQTFNSCINLEVVDMSPYKKPNHFVTALNFYSVFARCSKLRVVYGFDLSPITNKVYTNDAFSKCSSLEIVKIINLKVDISFNDSPLLSKESIVHIISNATPSSPITITLHPTAYAMATADPEIQAELEKQPNISLAEGEPTA